METFSDYSDRTDALAKHLGLRIADLSETIGTSVDMIMGYRTGRYPISAKAWRKLAAAEREAGIKAGMNLEEPSGSAYAAPSTTGFEQYLKFIRLCREEAQAVAGSDSAMTERILDRLIATWLSSRMNQPPHVSAPAGAAIPSDAELMRQAAENVKRRQQQELKGPRREAS